MTMMKRLTWITLSLALLAASVAPALAQAEGQAPSEIDQLVSNGWENYRNGLYKEAVRDFRRVVRMDSKNVSAAEGLGAAAYQLQDWPNAKMGYETAVELAPENCGFSKSLAYVYLVMKLYDRAILEYEKVSGVPGRPGCDPADNSAKVNLGYLYFRSQDESNESKAIQILNQVTNSEDADTGTLTRAHYYLGMLYKKRKNYDLAMQNLEKSFELSPDRTEGRDVLGQILFNKKEYDKALEHLLFALEENENDYNLNIMTGIIYSEQGAAHRDDAIHYLSKAANLARLMDKPPSYLPHRYLGDLYIDMGEPSKAIEAADEGLKITDNSTEEAGLIAVKGKALSKLGRHDDAINWFEKIQDDPTWGPYANKELVREEEMLRRQQLQEEN